MFTSNRITDACDVTAAEAAGSVVVKVAEVAAVES